jgi:DNA-binding SARP family transcriptional activator
MHDLSAVVAEHGFEAGVSLVQKFKAIDPAEEIVNERTCNAAGYDAMARKAFTDAIEVFRLCATTHPASANAQDSLGDGYLAAGQKPLAIAAYLRAAALASDDPAIRPEDKKAFIAEENAKAQQLSRTQ